MIASGVGILASFSPETDDTVSFLRVWRAGRQSVALKGVLLKRKKAGWRESAPLGPLAWKRRVFVLGPRDMPYYSRASSAGDPIGYKGTVPLDGWVEVARVGPEVGASSRTFGADVTGKANCFIVRTGKTFHAFQAPSAEEAQNWIKAITINAQHVGAMQHSPQCIILPTEADAVRVSSIIHQQRQNLLRAMSSAARERLGVANGEMTLDIAPQFAPRRTATEEEADYQAAAAFASEDDDDGEEASGRDDDGGPSVEEALALAELSGGVTEEFLLQLPPAVAQQVMRRMQIEGATDSDIRARLDFVDGGSEQYWMFVNDTDPRPQGPLAASEMFARLSAGLLNASTLVRSCSSIPGLGIEHCADEAGVPMMFIPLGVLFEQPLLNRPFDSSWKWVAAYKAAALFESVVGSATQLGVDRGLAAHHALFMKDNGLPPDLSLLLDLCGVAILRSDPAKLIPENSICDAVVSAEMAGLT